MKHLRMVSPLRACQHENKGIDLGFASWYSAGPDCGLSYFCLRRRFLSGLSRQSDARPSYPDPLLYDRERVSHGIEPDLPLL